MPRLLSRAAFASVAFQQAKKFASSPQGKRLIAQVKTRANDPATRAKVSEMASKVRLKVAQR